MRFVFTTNHGNTTLFETVTHFATIMSSNGSKQVLPLQGPHGSGSFTAHGVGQNLENFDVIISLSVENIDDLRTKSGPFSCCADTRIRYRIMKQSLKNPLVYFKVCKSKAAKGVPDVTKFKHLKVKGAKFCNLQKDLPLKFEFFYDPKIKQAGF